MDNIGVDQAAVVGHSMGSLIAMETAVRHADHVRALALVGASVPMPVTNALLHSAEYDEPTAIEMLTLWGYSRSAQIGGNATPGMWMLGGGQRLLQKAEHGTILADLKACNAYVDGLENARGINCPALLILGGRDSLTPIHAAKAVSNAIPGADTVILERAGHASPDEAADGTREKIS